MLYAYNAIRLAYTIRGGINDMRDDIRVTVNTVKMLNDLRNAIRC